MPSVNKGIIVGNLGRDRKHRRRYHVQVERPEHWRAKGVNRMGIRISFFGRLAEIVGEYLKKGASVYIEGRLQTRKYTDKDGVEKYATDVIAENMQMLGGRAGAGSDDDDGTHRRPTQPPQQSRPAPRQATTAPARRPAGGGAGGTPPNPGPRPSHGSDFPDDDDIPFAFLASRQRVEF